MQLILVGLILITALSILYALGEIVDPARKELSWLLVGAYFSLAIMSLHGFCLLSGYLLEYSQLLGCYIPFNLLLGPSFSRYIMKRLRIPVHTSLWIHFSPAVIATFGFIVFQSDGGGKANHILQTSFSDPVKGLEEFSFLGFLNLHFLIYIGHLIRRIVQSIGYDKVRKDMSTRLTFGIMVFATYTSIISFLGFQFWSGVLLGISIWSLLFFLVFLYLIERRYPRFGDDLESIVRQGKYKNSRLKGRDLNQIKRDIDELMNTEKIYCEEDISLAILANHLGLSVHQLSEYFNQKLKKTFVSYINEFRVRDAQRLLLEEPDTTILAIGYQVGFNSKSAFNAAFLKDTGCTPSAYRQNLR